MLRTAFAEHHKVTEYKLRVETRFGIDVVYSFRNGSAAARYLRICRRTAALRRRGNSRLRGDVVPVFGDVDADGDDDRRLVYIDESEIGRKKQKQHYNYQHNERRVRHPLHEQSLFHKISCAICRFKSGLNCRHLALCMRRAAAGKVSFHSLFSIPTQGAATRTQTQRTPPIKICRKPPAQRDSYC